MRIGSEPGSSLPITARHPARGGDQSGEKSPDFVELMGGGATKPVRKGLPPAASSRPPRLDTGPKLGARPPWLQGGPILSPGPIRCPSPVDLAPGRYLIKGLTGLEERPESLPHPTPLELARFDEHGLLSGTSPAGLTAHVDSPTTQAQQVEPPLTDFIASAVETAEAGSNTATLTQSLPSPTTIMPIITGTKSEMSFEFLPNEHGIVGTVTLGQPVTGDAEIDHLTAQYGTTRSALPVASLDPVMVALHEVEGGHKLLAKLGEIDGDERDRLHAEITALLAQHGLSAASIDIVTRRQAIKE